MTKHHCCDSFRQAEQDQTDNEGWGTLVFVDPNDGFIPTLAEPGK